MCWKFWKRKDKEEREYLARLARIAREGINSSYKEPSMTTSLPDTRIACPACGSKEIEVAYGNRFVCKNEDCGKVFN